MMKDHGQMRAMHSVAHIFDTQMLMIVSYVVDGATYVYLMFQVPIKQTVLQEEKLAFVEDQNVGMRIK
ncbi:hypothetical protein N7462_005235 [Penicillium macrosclerotiorum]|uniref:uncharacterized protein n=1 Tax=Penicillium macrosclerotiorum TaxID=303699 RepID=UPI002547FFE1|nr:uncharacterized protein N7462_005235 [Penicillium macrosclerotiorum]KAJ5690843.1 hypothetical protein N7462_005235 [Penicillium macrosclerotiorum]